LKARLRPAQVSRACALGCPAGPLRGPFPFPDPARFLTSCETIYPQSQVCPAASAGRGEANPPCQSVSLSTRRWSHSPEPSVYHDFECRYRLQFRPWPWGLAAPDRKTWSYPRLACVWIAGPTQTMLDRPPG